MQVSIEASDVIRLILQFFQEHGLDSSLAALQRETGISTRTLADVDGLIASILAGRWDAVLQALAPLQLEARLLLPLYEHVFLELAEAGEVDAARLILRQSEPLGLLRREDETRYVKLENALSTATLSKTAGAAVDLVLRKQSKRARLAQDLAAHVSSVPAGRLLVLLGEALRFEAQQSALHPDESGGQLVFDVFRGVVPAMQPAADEVASSCYRTVTMAHGQHVECAAFSPDGAYFAVGLADGFVEVWSPASGAPRTDLVYQAHKAGYMVMEAAVLCLAFAPDSTHLASAALNGDVVLWRAATGVCVRRIPAAHKGGVASLAFARDGLSLLTAGYDNAVRIYSVRTGALVREFLGHTAFVHDARFSAEGVRVLSASSDGTLRIWSTQTGECLQTVHPVAGSGEQLVAAAVRAVSAIPRHPDAFAVCSQACQLPVYGAGGSLGKSMRLPSTIKPATGFVTACSSPTGAILYGFADDRHVYCFDYATGTHTQTFASTDAELIGACHHPQLNLLVTYDTANVIKFWKAP